MKALQKPMQLIDHPNTSLFFSMDKKQQGVAKMQGHRKKFWLLYHLERYDSATIGSEKILTDESQGGIDAMAGKVIIYGKAG